MKADTKAVLGALGAGLMIGTVSSNLGEIVQGIATLFGVAVFALAVYTPLKKE